VQRLTLLATAANGPGGIQRFNRMLAHALSEICDGGRGELEVLSLIDRGIPEAFGRVCKARSFAGDRVRFATAALSASVHTDFLIVGHVNFLPLTIHLLAASRLHRHPRVAVVLHGIEAWNRLPLLSRVAGRRVDRLLAVSRYTAERSAVANGLQHVGVALLSDALDPAFEPWLWSDELPGSTHQPQLLSISRLSRFDAYKGVDAVIRSLPAVLRACPRARYVIVGDGALVPELRTLAEKLGVGDAVQFRGWVSETDLAQTYLESSIFVLPSSGEGFGIVYLEAMAFGRPVVAARDGATPEVVCDGATGLLVQSGDVTALADAMTRLLLDAELRTRLGAAGRARVQTHFTYHTFVERTRGIVTDLLLPFG
jgi:glycosyltransferase involved in cell wall biosynthesis